MASYGGAKSKNVAEARLGEKKAAEATDLVNKILVQAWGQEEAAKKNEELMRSREESKMMRNEQRNEAGGILNKCGGCGEKGKRRCSGCHVEYYCGEDCQREDWGTHKDQCKKVRKQFKKIVIKDIDTRDGVSDDMKSLDKMMRGEVAEKHLVVQIALTGTVMLATNQDKSMVGLLLRSPGQEEVYDQLMKQVMEKGQEMPASPSGARCFKAYFYGMYKKRTEGNDGHKIKINPEQVLPMEEW